MSLLDLVFAVDCTGSMASYIAEAQKSIKDIIQEIVTCEKVDVRFALVCYRDHPPQDTSYVTRVFDFTSSLSKMKENVNTMDAFGGGDTPEAVATALRDVLDLKYRDKATKVAVIIADAPPHGIQCPGDGFPVGEPNGVDPLAVVRQMAERRIILYSVGCEPQLSSTPNARDFFEGIAKKCSGRFVPLSKASLLPKVIVGAAVEEIGMERLNAELDKDIDRIQEDVRRDVSSGTVTASRAEEEVSSRLHEILRSREVKTAQLHFDDFGAPAVHADAFFSSASLAEARDKVPAAATAESSGPVFASAPCAAGPMPGMYMGGASTSSCSTSSSSCSTSSCSFAFMPSAPPPPPRPSASRSSAAAPMGGSSAAATSDMFEQKAELTREAITDEQVKKLVSRHSMKKT